MRTFNVLLKKCFRDIVRNIKQFIAIIFIIAVAVTLFIGLEANSKEFERRVNVVYEKGNIADIWVTVNPDFFSTQVDDDYNKIVEFNGGDSSLVEKRFYYPSSINNFSTNALMSKDFPKINTAYEYEFSSDLNLNNFFVIDKAFATRYESLTQKRLKLGDTLPITFDVSSITDLDQEIDENSEEVINSLIEGINENSEISSENKTLLINFIENNKDKVITLLKNSVSKISEIDEIEINVTINGFMKHPENIQSATFNDSSYLLSSKLFLKKLLTKISENISFEDERIQLIFESVFSNIESDIDNESNDFLNSIMSNFANQYIIKVEDKNNLSYIKDEINFYYKDKDNLIALTDINSMPSNAVIQSDIVQSRQFTYAFPIIFFLVAILVVLTTISQLILKERTQIGTLKSLGLTRHGVLLYYLSMMLVITLIGVILGCIIGPLLIPYILNIKYSILYSLPSLSFYFPTVDVIIVTLCILGAVSLLTYLLIKKEISLTPANSMRPAIPKIKFNKKKTNKFKNISLMMALRNIKVHITKSLMVVLGILGCTGLLICGMGIDDTINYGKDTDLGSFLSCDLQLTYGSKTIKDTANKELLELKDAEGNNFVTLAEEYSTLTTTISKNGNNYNANVYYFSKDATTFKYPKWDDLNGEGIAINESKADEYGYSVGDKITFKVGSATYTKTIASIFYSFSISGLFIYTETIPELSNYRTNCWVNITKGYSQNEAKELILSSNITEVNNILTYSENVDRIDGYMQSVRTMTNTIKMFALVLACIVLVNLSILNFRERLRDYATLKVLGYSRFEISKSMIYETMILTAIGSILGVFAGLPLEIIVLATNKTPLVSWKYLIYPQTYVYAFLISFVTALIINIIMTHEIKKISMSESLKSVE